MATKKKPAKKAKTTRKAINWDAIDREVKVNQLSLKEIARQHDISDTAIRKRMKAKGIKRDLAKKVHEKVREKLVRDEVRDPNASDEEIAEAAANQGVKLVKLHRKDIAKMQALEQKLLAELKGSPQKTWVGQFQGKVITKNLNIAVTERASALQALAQVQHKRIALERQAYNLGESEGGGDDEGIIKFKGTITLDEATKLYLDKLR